MIPPNQILTCLLQEMDTMCQITEFLWKNAQHFQGWVSERLGLWTVQLSNGSQVFQKNFKGTWGIYLHIPLLHWKPKHSSFECDIKLSNYLSSALNDKETINRNNAYTSILKLFECPFNREVWGSRDWQSNIIPLQY